MGEVTTIGLDIAKQVFQAHGADALGGIDPFGHRRSLVTHIEDVAPEEMQRRLDVMTGVAADADA